MGFQGWESCRQSWSFCMFGRIRLLFNKSSWPSCREKFFRKSWVLQSRWWYRYQSCKLANMDAQQLMLSTRLKYYLGCVILTIAMAFYCLGIYTSKNDLDGIIATAVFSFFFLSAWVLMGLTIYANKKASIGATDAYVLWLLALILIIISIDLRQVIVDYIKSVG